GRPYFLALLGEALGQAGKIEEGIALINSSLSIINSTSERLAYSDIYRLKGELLLAGQGMETEDAIGTDQRISIEAEAEAEDYFRQAIEYARRQQTKSLELRAVVSLSRLLQNQRRKDEARQMLLDISGWFTEGHDTIDLRKAKELLDEMS
ncbi:MAG: hypothetical protein ACREAB_10085, partial [Blastocatellia bacterium]